MGAGFETHDRREVVPETSRTRGKAGAARIDRDGAARLPQPPAAQVEEVDRLFESPASDPPRVVAPASRAETVRPAPDVDSGVLRSANRSFFDDLPYAAPLRRVAQLVSDIQNFSAGSRCVNQRLAIGVCGGHRL